MKQRKIRTAESLRKWNPAFWVTHIQGRRHSSFQSTPRRATWEVCFEALSGPLHPLSPLYSNIPNYYVYVFIKHFFKKNSGKWYLIPPSIIYYWLFFKLEKSLLKLKLHWWDLWSEILNIISILMPLNKVYSIIL